MYIIDVLFSFFCIFEIKILIIVIYENIYIRFFYLNIIELIIESIILMVCIL